MDIFNDVVVFSVAKVTKCFEKILFEVIILFLVFQKGKYHPNKRYCSYVERTYCNAFGLKSRMHWLAQTFCITCQALFGEHGRLLQPLIPVTSAKLARRFHIFLFVLFQWLSNKSAFGESWNLSPDDSESWICARYATCCSSCICKLSSLWNHMGD